MELPERTDVLPRGERLRLERAFAAWLVAGGFPEAQGLDTAPRHQLLRDYVDVAVLRDVVERHGVGNVTGLRWLVRQLLGNAGSRLGPGCLKTASGGARENEVRHQI